MNPRLMWPLLFAVGAAAEARAIVRHDGTTLSETWRSWAHTDTTAGKYVTGIGFGLLFGWLVPHLNRTPR